LRETAFDIIESQSDARGGEVEEHSLSQRFLAETLGTALLVLVGPGSVVATLVLAGDKVPAIDGSDLLGISFAFGLVITALVYAIGKISGCHINPAVTFALAATKRFPWREVPHYWGAQLVGGTLGALGIWALFTQTGILMFAILGIVDARSPGDFAGIVIGGVVVAIIMVVGPITAASLNPARAFGPELVLAIGGGTTHWNQIIPVYVLPGLAGAAAAAFAYDFLATPRKVARPIKEAVTHPDPVDVAVAK
jgi:glycerol uptake facilitator protein